MKGQKQCGKLTIQKDDTAPYIFLRLLKEKGQISFDELRRRNYTKWIPLLPQWRRHFINFIVDNTRHWIIIKNETVTLHHIGITPPNNWTGFKGHKNCYDADGNPNFL